MNSIGKAVGGVIGFIGVCIIVGISNSIKQTNRQNEANRKIYQAQQEREKSINESKRSLEQLIERNKPTECEINIKNEERALGLDASIFYLCLWEPYNDNKEKIPDLIQQYIYENENGEGIGTSISVTPFKQDFTPEKIEKIFKEKVEKGVVENRGDRYISSKRIEVDGVKGTQVTSKKSSKEGTMYLIENHFYYGNLMLSVSYFVSAKTDTDAKSRLNDFNPVFEFLVNKTKFN